MRAGPGAAETRRTLGAVGRWARELEGLSAHIGRHVVRPEPRRRLTAYLRAVVGGVERRNGWQLAEAAGEATPDGMQRLLTTAHWDVDAVRDDLRPTSSSTWASAKACS